MWNIKNIFFILKRIFLTNRKKINSIKFYRKRFERIVNDIYFQLCFTQAIEKKMGLCSLDTKGFDKELNDIWYVVLAILDIITYIEIMSNSKNEKHNKIIARNLITLIYETTNDINEIIGKYYFNKKNNLISPKDIDILKKLKKKISDYDKKYWSDFKTIRLNISAHRNHNILKQLWCLDSINHILVFKITMKYLIWLDNLVSHMFTISLKRLENLQKKNI